MLMSPKTFNTIDEWLDDKVIETELNPELIHDGDVIKRLTGSLKAITRLSDGLDTVRYLKKKIKEISDMNVLKAQQKLASALRKRIKDIKDRVQLESRNIELELKGMHRLLVAFRDILSNKLSHLKFTEDLNLEYENGTLYSRDKVKSVLLKEVSAANNLINEIEHHINLFHDWD